MKELLQHFGVNWKLLLAQAINFLIIFFVLKKFAFGPIMAILRKRKQEIEKGFEMRKEAEQNLNRIDQLKEETLAKARNEALGIVNNAQMRAEERKEEILAEATKKSEGIVTDAKRRIREEKAKMTEEFVGDAEELVRMGIARVLGKMPAEERDQQLIHEAMRALKTEK